MLPPPTADMTEKPQPAAIYYVEVADAPNNSFGEPDRSPAGLEWYERFHARHNQGKLEKWMLDYFPQNINVEPSESGLTDFIATHVGYCVSPRAKNLIEELEPGTHQFIPVLVRCASQKQRYYILRIGNSRDCYDLSRSDVRWRSTYARGQEIKFWIKRAARPIAFLRSEVGQMQLFQNDTGFPMILVSQHLHDLFEENGISGLKYERQVVV